MRHPLERLLSAYRHVFERENTYEDEFMKVVSLKQVEWSGINTKLLNNDLYVRPRYWGGNSRNFLGPSLWI